MKKIDFAAQTLVFLTAIGLLIYAMFEDESIMLLMYLQMLLGGLQLLSWLISIIGIGIGNADSRIKKGYIIYTIAVAAFFLIWYVGSHLNIDETMAYTFIFGPPWIIALYYYHLCYLKLKIQKNREHSFLDLN